jgi:hypothetical protein
MLLLSVTVLIEPLILHSHFYFSSIFCNIITLYIAEFSLITNKNYYTLQFTRIVNYAGN